VLEHNAGAERLTTVGCAPVSPACLPAQAAIPAMTDPDPIALCLAGRISPPVMLARLVLAGGTSATIRQRLAARPDAAALLDFLAPRAAAIDRMHAMLAQVDHASGADLAGIAAQFDSAVAAEPEASVAAYSLGDPALLDQATAEVVGWLTAQRLFADGMDVLDLGCGFGRIAAALAPHAGSVLGLDLSPGMIEAARRRHGGLPRLAFAVAEGRDLGTLPAASRDLILAVDSFPYLFQAGVAEAHLRDAARVLRPGGALAVLNLTYAADPADDRAQALAWAADAGLRIEQDGARPFTLWDAAAFVFRLG
jgi:SAM-dependent methyltransferase